MKKKVKKHRKKRAAIIPKRDYSLPERVEQALVMGNLINLLPEERVQLVTATCKSLRLNPLTKPFIYILMKDYDDEKKLILYASRNCTDQLRTVRGVTVVPGSLKQWKEGDYLKAQVAVMDRTGRTDEDLGVINLKQYRGNPVNAEMHVVTKAKRRATLSLCGLGGIVDESELDTMNVIGGVTASGRIFEYPKPKLPMPRLTKEEIVDAKNTGNWCEKHSCDMRKCPSDEHSQKELDEWFERVQRAKQFASSSTASKPTQSVPTGGQTLPGPQSPVQHAAGTEGGAPSSATTLNASPSAPKKAKEAPKATVAATGKPAGKGNGNQAIPLDTPSATNAPTGSLNFKPPQARIPVKVTIAKWTKSGKYPTVQLDTGKWLVCFRNHKMGDEQLFNLLIASAGKTCIFLSKESKGSDGKPYTQITRLLRMGDREWGEDGVPILRREPATKPQREPGDDAPEEWLK